VPADESDRLPPMLPVAAILQARNTEYNLDLTGRVTHLDQKSLVTSFPVEVPEGTVLFSIIDLRATNAMVRGLIRVRSQSEAGDLGGFRTLADFVDLNNDERRKITRLLGGPPEAGLSPHESSHEPSSVPISPGSTIAPRRRRMNIHISLPSVSLGSFIWGVLGVIFYSIVLAGVVAIFPQGRAWEISTFHRVMHQLNHLWPGFSHLFGLLNDVVPRS
jgi:hypothetical protein